MLSNLQTAQIAQSAASQLSEQLNLKAMFNPLKKYKISDIDVHWNSSYSWTSPEGQTCLGDKDEFECLKLILPKDVLENDLGISNDIELKLLTRMKVGQWGCKNGSCDDSRWTIEYVQVTDDSAILFIQQSYRPQHESLWADAGILFDPPITQ
ncbi:hypothetical protein D5018_09310 [Parashewanella curva]|uniref:Uncharacterized protein n=1 Tax=Parashewanella curva TaxID=2338552 RepID=A0A3L8Q0S4_9GAMM|nr:hypothetical protein [Parashewanella curva]RLV59992.1 hypothetical protein D5018_09310 [Parashewanella curva]